MAQIDYEKHAENFFKKIDVQTARCYETSLYNEACKYVDKESDFKYKDPVEVDCLLSTLQDRDLIEYKGSIKFPNKPGISKYLITEKGEQYVTDYRKKSK